MFSKKCFCKYNISKIVRSVLAALSDNWSNSTGTASFRVFFTHNNILDFSIKTFPCMSGYVYVYDLAGRGLKRVKPLVPNSP